MNSKHNKNPQIHKTPEELIRDTNRHNEFLAKMEFVKTKFWPALCLSTTSIEDATQNLTIINSVIMEKFLGRMKEVLIKDLSLETNLSASDPKFEQLREMLHLFDDMSVFEAKSYFEGMKGEIALFLSEEQKERTLDSLKAKWADEATTE